MLNFQHICSILECVEDVSREDLDTSCTTGALADGSHEGCGPLQRRTEQKEQIGKYIFHWDHTAM